MRSIGSTGDVHPWFRPTSFDTGVVTRRHISLFHIHFRAVHHSHKRTWRFSHRDGTHAARL